MDLTGTGGLGRFLDRTLFHLRDAGGHTDHDAGANQMAGIVHLGDEVAQHGLGHLEVGDDAVLHGTDGLDVAGGLAQHALGVGAHGQAHGVAARIFLDRHHGRFTQDDALTLDIDTGVGRAQVDGQVIGEHSQEEIHNFGHYASLPRSTGMRMVLPVVRRREGGTCGGCRKAPGRFPREPWP